MSWVWGYSTSWMRTPRSEVVFTGRGSGRTRRFSVATWRVLAGRDGPRQSFVWARRPNRFVDRFRGADRLLLSHGLTGGGGLSSLSHSSADKSPERPQPRLEIPRVVPDGYDVCSYGAVIWSETADQEENESV